MSTRERQSQFAAKSALSAGSRSLSLCSQQLSPTLLTQHTFPQPAPLARTHTLRWGSAVTSRHEHTSRFASSLIFIVCQFASIAAAASRSLSPCCLLARTRKQRPKFNYHHFDELLSIKRHSHTHTHSHSHTLGSHSPAMQCSAGVRASETAIVCSAI